MNYRRVALSCVILAGLLSACGQGIRASSPDGLSAPPEQSPDASRPPGRLASEKYRGNWDEPFGGSGRKVSVAEAQPQISFTVKEPTGLGNPISIFLERSTDPSEDDVEVRQVAFVYDTPKYGRVVIKEMLDQNSVASWNAAVQSVVSPAPPAYRTSGNAESATLPGEKGLALIAGTNSGDFAGIRWKEGNVRFSVEGPYLSREARIEIASKNI